MVVKFDDKSEGHIIHVCPISHVKCNNTDEERVLQSTTSICPHERCDPTILVILHTVREVWISRTKLSKNFHCFPHIVLSLLMAYLTRQILQHPLCERYLLHGSKEVANNVVDLR